MKHLCMWLATVNLVLGIANFSKGSYLIGLFAIGAAYVMYLEARDRGWK